MGRCIALAGPRPSPFAAPRVAPPLCRPLPPSALLPLTAPSTNPSTQPPAPPRPSPPHLRPSNEQLVPLPRGADVKQRAGVVLRLDARPVAAVLAHGQAGAQAQALLLGAVLVQGGLGGQEAVAGGGKWVGGWVGGWGGRRQRGVCLQALATRPGRRQNSPLAEGARIVQGGSHAVAGMQAPVPNAFAFAAPATAVLPPLCDPSQQQPTPARPPARPPIQPHLRESRRQGRLLKGASRVEHPVHPLPAADGAGGKDLHVARAEVAGVKPPPVGGEARERSGMGGGGEAAGRARPPHPAAAAAPVKPSLPPRLQPHRVYPCAHPLLRAPQPASLCPHQSPFGPRHLPTSNARCGPRAPSISPAPRRQCTPSVDTARPGGGRVTRAGLGRVTTEDTGLQAPPQQVLEPAVAAQVRNTQSWRADVLSASPAAPAAPPRPACSSHAQQTCPPAFPIPRPPPPRQPHRLGSGCYAQARAQGRGGAAPTDGARGGEDVVQVSAPWRPSGVPHEPGGSTQQTTRFAG